MKYLQEERFIVHSNSKEALRNYSEGWERTFGEKPAEPDAAESDDSDAIEMRVRTFAHYCSLCRAYVTDPENHQYHGVIALDDAPPKVQIGWWCPCCSSGRIVMIDREVRVFECEGRVRHGFDDVP